MEDNTKSKVRCAELRLLDDDFDIEKYTIEACEKALETLSNEIIKTRIITKPQIFVFSTAFNKNDFLSCFKQASLNDHIIDTSNYGVVSYWNFGTYYKPMKMRKRNRGVRKWKI